MLKRIKSFLFGVFGWAIKRKRKLIPYRWKAVLKFRGRKYKYNCGKLDELITKLVKLNLLIK